MTNTQQRLDVLLREAEQAHRAGDRPRANAAFRDVLAIVPGHPVALNALGMAALGQDDRLAAEYFSQAAQSDPAATPLWMNLASAYRGLGDADAERDALNQALAIDQRNLMANVRLAELLDRIGDTATSAFRWGGVVTIVQSMPDRSPALEDLLALASDRIARHTQTLADDVESAMRPLRETTNSGHTRRFDACVDTMLGRRRVYAPAPHGLHFPFLPADEFFAREHFPWLADLEAATPAILAELQALLAAPATEFVPYVAMAPGTPANLWSPLNNSDNWSARYLSRYGVRDDAVCARCPQTAALLDSLPLADIPGRAPTAFFSVLKPGTHLPPHTGVSNIRSVVHLPLIVPDHCGFRVGGETREWRVGEAFVFDDTIEHEAWNDSASIRAVLIVDVWNPYLTTDETAMLRHLFGTLGNKLGGGSDVAE
ncbi:aspartyl/asparaginyl beta-hydroxylase domain-containing protein [Sphingomonas faeni]|uniref:aspartyl/asparaginyl beta-hydroxylase domain-containing protein n=1 Tax=Sphingomonas faeni TaxID=185950 RepID=UPI003351F60C